MELNSFGAFKAFGSVAGKYLDSPQEYADLISFLPDFKGLLEAARAREKQSNHNALLQSVFHEQLKDFYEEFPLVKENVEAFGQSSTLCITTGHQLVLAGGPAYLYYKIATAIALSRQVSELTGIKVVPVFWLASEDHDIEEIKEGNIRGKNYRWEGSWNGYSGVLPTHLLQDWRNNLLEELKQAGAPIKIISRIEKSYRPGISLAEATRDFVLDVFGPWGILVLNPDDRRLKSLFTPVIIEEVKTGKSYSAMQDLLVRWDEIWKIPKLEPQVKPREINLFYLHENGRSRIIADEKGIFSAGNLSLGNLEELVAQIKVQPEKFSPNVVLRPVYQELILPNIAYIGGPGEIHYWLELKPVFDALGVFYPVLLPRLSLFALSEKQMNKWTSLGLTQDDFSEKIETVQKKQLQQFEENSIEWELARKEIEIIFNRIKEGVGKIDATLQAAVMAELNKSGQSLDQLKGRVNKALKLKNETVLRQSEKIMAELFPGGVPQERMETGLGIEWQIGEGFVKKLAEIEILPGRSESFLLKY